MSYILDALRKSEDQRRLGQPPDLATAPTASPAYSARRFTWRWAGAVLVVLAIFTALGLWFLMQQRGSSGSESVITDPAVSSAPAASSSAGPPDTDQDLDAQSTAGRPAEQSPPSERRRRTVADRRSPSQQPATAVSRPAPARPGAVPIRPPVVPEGEREQLVTDPEQARRLVAEQMRGQTASSALGTEAAEPSVDRTPSKPAESSPQLPADASTRTATGDPATEDWSPERVEFLEVWDLPLSVRQELPDLDLSIHVFSGEPAERFVLINGERRLEGASLGGGVRVAEIVRQGAIVEFRDYRFLIRP